MGNLIVTGKGKTTPGATSKVTIVCILFFIIGLFVANTGIEMLDRVWRDSEVLIAGLTAGLGVLSVVCSVALLLLFHRSQKLAPQVYISVYDNGIVEGKAAQQGVVLQDVKLGVKQISNIELLGQVLTIHTGAQRYTFSVDNSQEIRDTIVNMINQ